MPPQEEIQHGSKQRSNNQIRALIAERKSNGLKLSEFCKSKGISDHYYYKFRDQLMRSEQSALPNEIVASQERFVSLGSISPLKKSIVSKVISDNESDSTQSLYAVELEFPSGVKLRVRG